jgi:hypothetical protein
MRTALVSLAVLASLFAASAARADAPPADAPSSAAAPGAEPDEATKDRARKVAAEGLDLFDAGKYEAALDRFRRAEAMVHAPTMHLMAARALVKLGRVLEANDEYDATIRAELPPNASEAFKSAPVDAAKEQKALAPRIPAVAITVSAPPGVQVTVSLDGKPVPPGRENLVDPGAHSILAVAGGVTRSSPIELKEGERRTVALDLAPSAGAPGSAMRAAGFVGLGLGAAGIVVGAVTGGLALAKKGDLEKQCPTHVGCPVSQTGDIAGYDALRAVSSAGFYGGAALAAVGAALLIAAPSPKAVGSARVTPFVGLGSAGVQGTF